MLVSFASEKSNQLRTLTLTWDCKRTSSAAFKNLQYATKISLSSSPFADVMKFGARHTFKTSQ